MKAKWSKEKIVEEIKKLKQKNVNLAASSIYKTHCPLFTAACSKRYFSSWANAVRAAGVDYDAILKIGKERRREQLTLWSKKEILTELKKIDEKSLLTIYRDRLALYSAARREFGNWINALEAIGYRLKKGSYKNTNHLVKKEE